MQPLIITGATGTLGRAFARVCDVRGLPYRLTDRADMDIADPAPVRSLLQAEQPWAVINTAGYVRVDEAEHDVERCCRENADGPATVAAVCASFGIPLVTFSSDLVFDGTKGRPYVESDQPNPLNVYGRTKAEAETRVLAAAPDALVVRTSAFFGPWDVYNFVYFALRELAAGREFVAAEDGIISPTYVPDLANASLDLLLDRESGIWHLTNQGAVSWAEFARIAATMAGIDTTGLIARSARDLGLTAPRPANTSMTSERGTLLPPLEHALGRFLVERVTLAA